MLTSSALERRRSRAAVAEKRVSKSRHNLQRRVGRASLSGRASEQARRHGIRTRRRAACLWVSEKSRDLQRGLRERIQK